MRSVSFVVSLFCFSIAGCGAHEDRATHEPVAPRPERNEDAPVGEGLDGNSEGPSEITGVIRATSPLGHGRCTQRSYEVEVAGGATEWLHWERCGDDRSGADHSGLEVGRSYRFDVRRGTGGSFGDAPMIESATPAPEG